MRTFCSGCLEFHDLPLTPTQEKPIYTREAETSSFNAPRFTDCNKPQLSEHLCHVLICTALGVGHYTPVSNFITALFSGGKHKSLRVTFFAPIREWEVVSCQPPNVSIQLVKCIQVPLTGEDVHPITMNAMITRKDELSSRIDQELMSSDPSWPPVTTVVHDFFAIYAFEYAEKQLGVPRIIFNPSHALCFKWLADLELSQRITRGERQLELNGFKRPVDIQMFWHMMSLGPEEPVFRQYNVKRLAKTAYGMITTDMECLFPEQLAEIRRSILEDRRFLKVFGTFPMFFAGPTCIYHQRTIPERLQSTDIKAWLDMAEPLSVIFISLGTLYPIPFEALKDLMNALARSGRPFLWSFKVKSNTSQEVVNLYYDFKERTLNQGLMVDWVDQRMILNHPSLRCFVTHGGWNSIVECLTFGGVPMICIPLGSEQPINGVLVKSGLDVGGVSMCEDETWMRPDIDDKEMEDALERLRQDSFLMIGVMLPFQQCKYRFSNENEWFKLIEEVCQERFSHYYTNAKEAQVKILKSTLPNNVQDQVLDEIVNYIESLKGISPPSSGDMSPITPSPKRIPLSST